MEIAKREEIGADLDAYGRFTSDDLWSAYQQALKDDTRIRYRLMSDAEVEEVFGRPLKWGFAGTLRKSDVSDYIKRGSILNASANRSESVISDRLLSNQHHSSLLVYI